MAMRVGLQMYSVKESFGKDPMGTMEKVAELGYRYWEICAFNSTSPYNYGLDLPVEEAVPFLQKLGVTIIGAHIGEKDLTDDEYLETFFDYQAAIGCLNPGIDSIFCETAQEIREKAELLNKCGRMCKARGMRFHYHNHFHEFQPFEGKLMLDHILDNTDPELVDFELDTYWALRGGQDPVQLIDRYGGRICMLHQKDLPEKFHGPLNLFDGFHDPAVPVRGWEDFHPDRKEDFVEVGTGIMDIQSIIDAGNRKNIPYITLEQDATKLDEIESVALSMASFRKYRGIQWD